MASNRLKMNPTKTGFMRCRRQHQLSKGHDVSFAGSVIQPSSTVRDLGIVLERQFGAHINQLVSRCFLQLRRIKSRVRFPPSEVAKAVVNSFVISTFCSPC